MADLLKTYSEFGNSDYQPNKNTDRLSIQLRLDGFSFCISNPSESHIIYFIDLRLSKPKKEESPWLDLANLLEEWLLNKKINHSLFKEVKIIIDHPHYTIIPSSFIDKENKSKQLEFGQNIFFRYCLIENNIQNNQLKIIFPVQINLNQVLNDFFPNSVIYHIATTLSDSIKSVLTKKNITSGVFVYISNRELHIFAFNNTQQVYQNCFSYSSKEDFIYFILLIYNHLNFKTEEIPTFLFGDINTSTPLYNICFQYIRNISLIHINDEINFEQGFDQFPIHQYFNQIQIAL